MHTALIYKETFFFIAIRCGLARRSLEGSVAALLSMMAFSLLVANIYQATTSDIRSDSGYLGWQLARHLLAPLSLVVLIEAYASTVDNLVLPLYATALTMGVLY